MAGASSCWIRTGRRPSTTAWPSAHSTVKAVQTGSRCSPLRRPLTPAPWRGRPTPSCHGRPARRPRRRPSGPPRPTPAGLVTDVRGDQDGQGAGAVPYGDAHDAAHPAGHLGDADLHRGQASGLRGVGDQLGENQLSIVGEVDQVRVSELVAQQPAGHGGGLKLVRQRCFRKPYWRFCSGQHVGGHGRSLLVARAAGLGQRGVSGQQRSEAVTRLPRTGDGSRLRVTDAKSTGFPSPKTLLRRLGSLYRVYRTLVPRKGQVMAQPVTNHQLEAAITDAEMTFDALARGVVRVAAEVGVHLRTNPSTVHKWLRGSDPEGDTPAFICEALFRRTGRPYTPAELGLRSVEQSDPGLGLSIGPDPVGVLARVWRADLDRRKFLAASAYSVAAIHLPLEYVRESAERTAAVRSGSVAGAAEVVAVRDMISMFTEIDERHGGQHGRSALIQYLRSDVAALCRGSFRTHEDRQQMLSAAAVGVHLAGWKAYDAGEQGLAQRYYHQSYALAVESGIVGHDAFVLRTLAQQGMKLRHPSKTFALSDTALTWAAGRVDAGTEALFTITHAHGLAATNQRRPAVLAVQRARDLLETADLDDMPYWARSWGPARATVNSAPRRSSPDSATARAPPRTTQQPQPPGRPPRTPASRPLTWLPRPRWNWPTAASSRRAVPGTGHWTAWRACSRSGRVVRCWRCARTWPNSRAAAYPQPRNSMSEPPFSWPDRPRPAAKRGATRIRKHGQQVPGFIGFPVRLPEGEMNGRPRQHGDFCTNTCVP